MGNNSKVSKKTKEKLDYKPLGNLLVVGAGSTAFSFITLARDFSQEITIVTRDSNNGRKVKAELQKNNNLIRSTGKIIGQGKIDNYYLGFKNNIQHPPNNILLSTPNQDYKSCVGNLSHQGLIRDGQTIIGISTRLGSGNEISDELKNCDFNPDKFNIVSFSTYYAATKPSDEKRTTVNTRAVKKKIYVGSTQPENPTTKTLVNILNKIGTEAVIIDTTLGSEELNANYLVHPQILMTKNNLPHVFKENSNKKYIYRSPEKGGCLDDESMLQMGLAEKEINSILTNLGYDPVNLLKMLQKDLYPIPDLTDESILNRYPSMSDQERASWLKTWFIERQKDPETGEPHLEAVKIQRIYKENGTTYIPRIPGEDYSGVVLLTEISKIIDLDTPTLLKMRQLFEKEVENIRGHKNIDCNEVEKEMSAVAKNLIDNK
jgi:hypothetical protein